jgi:endoglucanase
MKCSFVAKKSVTCVGSDWAKTLGKGQSVTVGLQVDAVKPPAAPALTVTAQ